MTNDPPLHRYTTTAQRLVGVELLGERHRQRAQWGDDHDTRHSVGMWFTILGVRVGRLLADALDPISSPAALHPDMLTDDERATLRHRAVQVAAVASALAEQLAPRPTTQEAMETAS